MAFKFRTQYSNFEPVPGQDLSNEFEQTYKELAPYERNEKGEFLNDSPFPKIVEAEKVNIQERIQSFFEDVDLYHILARVALTGDLDALNVKTGFYGDISNIPNNFNDINSYYKDLSSKYNSLDPKVKELINSGLTGDDLDNAIKKLSVENNVQKIVQEKNNIESENVENESK